jgi:O-antigen/teichoic acid export membrane protein
VPLALLFSASAVFFAASLLGCVMTVFDRTRAIAAINIVAAVVNAVLDVMLIGVLGAGVWAAAVATIASVTVIWLGYNTLAADCVGIGRRPHLAWLTPLIAATLPLMVLHGVAAIVISAAAALVVSVLGFLYGRLFRPADSGIVEELDMPESVRRWTIRLLQLTRA